MGATYVGLVEIAENKPSTSQLHSLTTVIDAVFETEYDTRVDRLKSPANVYGPYRNKASIGVKAVWVGPEITLSGLDYLEGWENK